MWATLGKWIGKGVVWLVRNPQALEVTVGVVKAAVAAKKQGAKPADPPPPPEAA